MTHQSESTIPPVQSSTDTSISLSSPPTIHAAQKPQYVAFLFRAPYAFDAYQLGFATGIREDYKLQQEKYTSLNLPVYMLDNHFKDPDLDRYLEVCRTHSPHVGVIGDAFTLEDAHDLVAAAEKARTELDSFEPIIVPKCIEALDIIPDDIIVGYANGYSDIKPEDFSTIDDWYGRHIHILGGTPPSTFELIQRLTTGSITASLTTPNKQTSSLDSFQSTPTPSQSLSDLSHTPANIIGVDWNGLYQWATKGDYWHHAGDPWWRDADHMTVRTTVRTGLQQIKQYWLRRDLWADTTPVQDQRFQHSYTPATHPEIPVCAGCGVDTWDTNTELCIVEYEDGDTRVFCSGSCRNRFEYYDGAIPLNSTRQDLQYLLDRSRADWVNAA